MMTALVYLNPENLEERILMAFRCLPLLKKKCLQNHWTADNVTVILLPECMLRR